MIAVALVALLAVVGWWWSRPRTVEVVEVTTREVVETYVATGRVSSPRSSLVGAALPGTVEAVRVDEGDRPAAGDLLVELRPLDAKAAVDQAKARLTVVTEELERVRKGATPEQLRGARANVQRARVDQEDTDRALIRVRALRDAGLSTVAELEAAEASHKRADATLAQVRAQLADLRAQPRREDLRVAEARVSEAQAALTRITADLGKMTIQAPYSGLVVAVEVSEGEQVGAGQGLVRLADLAQLEIYAEVDEELYGRLKEGMRATYLIPSLPGTRASGAVSQVGPEVDSSRGVVGLHLTAEELPEAMIPGLTVDVAIELRRVPSALAIPRSCMVRDGDEAVVFVVDGGVARRTPVTVVVEGEEFLAVEGLSAGASLVRDGTMVTAGASVRAQEVR